ncbi:nuclease-related domain-containing protein [Halobacillus mangrovi]|uniref:NERD domain-containing protein n=1 Tax=Halobacillus mangrovi TaxID=402384 RepID=A0A1W5ZRK9_9BACI|nr:nuclease-related domain-containing protein [Halobacillus mangrovi]ARI75922.1 hypothetical protein HM131_03360 [Halobacillus mangrovi]
MNRVSTDNPHWTTLHEQFLKMSAGLAGETTADHYLRYLPSSEFQPLIDLQLYDGIQHFQVDALVVNPKLLLIIEVKNYKGELIFDLEHHQLFRKIDSKTDIFPDPFLQVEIQTLQLTRCLQHYNFPPLPIYSLIVIANPNTAIQTLDMDQQNLKRIIRAKQLPFAVREIDKMFIDEVWSAGTIQHFQQQVRKKHRPYRKSILIQFQLEEKDIIKGVQCPPCGQFRMSLKRDHWYCVKCSCRSKDAHLQSLMDYQLLIGKEITTPDFMKFARIESRKVAWRLLSEACPEYYGETRSRKYIGNNQSQPASSSTN